MPEGPSFDKEKSSIDSLQERLYSRAEPMRTHARRRLEDAGEELPTDWGEGADRPKTNLGVYYEKNRRPVLKWLLIAAAVFFLGSAGFAVYVFMGGGHMVTGDNVNITVAGPVSVGGGEELPLDIVVDNENPTPLQAVSLAIDYPAGTRKPGSLSTDMSRYQEDLGDIPSGQNVKRSVSAVLFGEANSTDQIKVSVEYRVPGSSALFLKEKDYTITISSSPVSVVVATPPNIVSGQPFDLSVTVSSNSSSVLKGLVLQAEYGFGFTFRGSDPNPSTRTDFWQIGDLPPGGKQVIQIHGQIDGQNDEQRAFLFSVGTVDPSNPQALATTYVSSGATVTLARPDISVGLSVNGKAGNTSYTVSPGSPLSGTISWSNSSTNSISNLEIDAAFSGAAFDRNSVSTSGYYRSVDNTIVWDKSIDNTFASVAPGTQGTLDFQVAPLDLASLISAGIKNPQITLAITAAGTAQGSGASSNNTVTTTFKVRSKLTLASKLTYFDGPFTNSGPLPPVPDQQTTYTITWSLSNAVNDASNVVVSGRLPPYVRFLGVVSPQGESVNYDPTGSVVTWNAGDVSAFAGFSGSSRQVSFQVALLPSVTQGGQIITMMDQIAATGVDDFTNDTLTTTGSVLLSSLSEDSRATSADSTVSR